MKLPSRSLLAKVNDWISFTDAAMAKVGPCLEKLQSGRHSHLSGPNSTEELLTTRSGSKGPVWAQKSCLQCVGKDQNQCTAKAHQQALLATWSWAVSLRVWPDQTRKVFWYACFYTRTNLNISLLAHISLHTCAFMNFSLLHHIYVHWPTHTWTFTLLHYIYSGLGFWTLRGGLLWIIIIFFLQSI